MESKNLWSDLTGITGFKTPAIILKEQAEILGQLTGNYVTATVTQSAEYSTVTVNLYLKGFRLDKYSNNVLTVDHNIKGYPLKVTDNLTGGKYTANNEEEFIGLLNIILSSKEMRELIAALMSYAGKTKIEKKDDSK